MEIELSGSQDQDQGFLCDLEEHVGKKAGELAIEPVSMSLLPEEAGQRISISGFAEPPEGGTISLISLGFDAETSARPGFDNRCDMLYF